MAMISQLDQASMATNDILGVCGPDFSSDPLAYFFVWYPLLFECVIFIIFTPLSVYRLYYNYQMNKQMYNLNQNEGVNKYNKDLLDLSVRLILYSLFLCVSCVLILWINGELLFKKDLWRSVGREYTECLIVQNIDPDLECILDPDDELMPSIYYMFGAVLLLTAGSSFILSCSNAKYSQWKDIRDKVALKIVPNLQLPNSTKSHSTISRETTVVSSDEDVIEMN